MTILLSEGMEDKYRKLLGASKNKENNIAFFPSYWSYQKIIPLQRKQETSPESEANIDSPAVEKSLVTEKAVILDSLSLFGEEATKNEASFKFSGGELTKKETSHEHSISQLLTDLTWKENLKTKFLNNHFNFDLFDKKNPIVLFISDSQIQELDSDRIELSDLDYYFEPNVSDLFAKMIKAMRVEKHQYCISSLSSKNLDQDFLLEEIIYLNPKLIITLGAQATNYLLKSNMRLKDCHGQIQKININVKSDRFDYTLMPLFSPHLLYSAPNMKKTAWKDMQLAMDYLNL